MSIKTKWLSVVLVIVAALILLYGFIDKSGYRAGYTAGYRTVSRAVDAACVNGRVTDDDICIAAELALYEPEANNTLYTADAIANILPALASKPVITLTTPVTKKKRARKKTAPTASVAAPTSAPATPTFPAGLLPFMWLAKSETSIQQSSLVSNVTQANVTVALDQQKIIIAQCSSAKILLYKGGLPETEDISDTKGLASCPPAGISETGLIESASVKDTAGATYIIKRTGTFELDGSLGLVMTALPPPPPSPEEVLRAKVIAIDCAVAGTNVEACLKMDPYCVMSIVKRDGSGTYVNANYTAGCTDSEVKIKRLLDPNDRCSKDDIQTRMPRARMITGASGETLCSNNAGYIYLRKDPSSGELVPLGDTGSLSELLRSPDPTFKDFAQKAGAKAAPIIIAPPAPPPMQHMPQYMMGHSAAPSRSFFANIVETLFYLFRRPQY